jgi:hypothetical protein
MSLGCAVALITGFSVCGNIFKPFKPVFQPLLVTQYESI